MAADFHTAFNLALAVVFIFLLDPLARLLVHLLPKPAKSADPAAPLYLDKTAIDTPSVALACAARETLHMGDLVETMLRQSMTALMTNDRKLAAEVSQMDNAVDSLNEAVKLYVTRVTRESLDDQDGRRAMEIFSFAINLEHIGDIIDKNLMELIRAYHARCFWFFCRDPSHGRLISCLTFRPPQWVYDSSLIGD